MGRGHHLQTDGDAEQGFEGITVPPYAVEGHLTPQWRVYGQEAHIPPHKALAVALPGFRCRQGEGQFVGAFIEAAVVEDERGVSRDEGEVTARTQRQFEVVGLKQISSPNKA